MVKKVTWSRYNTPWLGTGGKLTVRKAIKQHKHRANFDRGLQAFEKKANRFETIDIHWWYYPYIYVDVRDERWQHYPCGHRALVSYDLTNGKWASFESDNRYTFARRGWGRFMDDLCGYKVRRYTDCGDRDKTTFC